MTTICMALSIISIVLLACAVCVCVYELNLLNGLVERVEELERRVSDDPNGSAE